MKFSTDIITAAITGIIAILSLYFSLRKESVKEATKKRIKEEKLQTTVHDSKSHISRLQKNIDDVMKKIDAILRNCKAHEALSNTADIEELRNTVESMKSQMRDDLTSLRDTIQATRDKLFENYVTVTTHNNDLDRILAYVTDMTQQWKTVTGLMDKIFRKKNGN